jgi:hypothetical protein
LNSGLLGSQIADQTLSDSLGNFIFDICEPDKRSGVEEKSYRQSRLCVFGNPIAFSIVELLVEKRDMSPSQLACALDRSLSRVSHTLAAPRLAEVVRYDSDSKRRARYRLKHPPEIRQVLRALSGFVDTASRSK